MRGEYATGCSALVNSAELPPRARRIHIFANSGFLGLGTTSACAENTFSPHPQRWIRWNYLRVRGEYLLQLSGMGTVGELPPRARRIRVFTGCFQRVHGTTSACAENTKRLTHSYLGLGNYLRVRGEYHRITRLFTSKWELPPRARRIHTAVCLGLAMGGTTSACAENTMPPPKPSAS